MKPIEQINEIPILTDVFIKNIEGKIKDFEADNFGGLLGVPPYIQWDNVKLNGNRLLIEKSAKPLGKFSRNADISGTIESEIISDKDKTILKAKIMLDTAMAEVLKYVLGIVVGLSGAMWLIFAFDFRVLIGLLTIEWFIFWVVPRFQNTAVSDLVDYYNVLIEEAAKK